MPALLESAMPPPSQQQWPSCFQPYSFTNTFPPSPIEMSSETLPPYMPVITEASLPAQGISHGLPSSGWYGSSVPAPDCQNERTGYGPFGYDQPYVTPHTSSMASFSPPTEFPKQADIAIPYPARASSLQGFSPPTEFSKMSHMSQQDYPRVSEAPFSNARTNESSLYGFVHMDHVVPGRPRSSPSTFSPTNPPGGPIDYSWTINPLGISTANASEAYYSRSSYQHDQPQTSKFSEPMTPVADIAAPQPRRMYAPIAPHPVGVQKLSQQKRSHDEDDSPDASKRRKRSESTATISMDLGEEDRLLIQLKDEENMPWKDIASKFQTELGKTYQIPALQMRLKRLRERMRVWSEADVKALRQAHDYWIQSKFEIISQKMVEYGASEKWSARQCARKWQEIDPGPTPYTTYEHPTSSYTTYTMSPVEAPPFLPFLHIP
ncbi:hypothetical protein K432DRAFT_384748 [Lepidopterella palustris CBS 459.81]|uniref:Myb-like domain-containing protein n=1 Tax=Lepidopterella palustris CBS 459.81 TaxID=1314670 RepID=A0A8E2E4Q2_9PEZI|nr:hypothetical protein K432DRAFT_384748 [Lepidopterella palustris CBS 459.81]